MVLEGEMIDAGEHKVAICRVESIMSDTESPRQQLSTAYLRDAGLISADGRAIKK